ncbi:hypothetical protein [Colwellia sp. MB02u-9]|uniref:hypothetical protein n=1 Tax=Colwellia sp. MB02u-9 TaxID=2759823 RepID=UPI002870425A|nr:hypothetical protein [Colwellia sp. MB02u-9]
MGEVTDDFMNQYQMYFGIIGISGISNDGHLFDVYLREVCVAQAIINNSTNVFLPRFN